MSEPEVFNLDENVCEHGDHPAPEGMRFCSPECEACEHAPFDLIENCCAGLCGKKGVEDDVPLQEFFGAGTLASELLKRKP